MSQFIVVGWPSCRYAQDAMKELREWNIPYLFLDEHEYGKQLLQNVPTYGSGSGKWRSPHIFSYVGGSSDLKSFLANQGQKAPVIRDDGKNCKVILGQLICE